MIGTDGLPISKSSLSQFWPQLGKISSLPHTPLFVIGLFHGSEKPNDPNLYMFKLVNELKNLLEEGFVHNNSVINVNRVAFVYDAPAKAFVLQIKGHSGFSFAHDVE